MLPPARWSAHLVFLVLVSGCARPAAPPEEDHPAPVKAVAAAKTALSEWTELIGTTQPLPWHSARVSAVVEGRVLQASDKSSPATVEGQEVQAGQVIVRLDDRVARATREKTSYTLKDLEEQRKQADYAVELAQIEVRRLEELSRANPASSPLPLVSRIELEKARVALKDADSKQKGMAARLDATKEELKALDEQLTFYSLRAPLSGRLGMLQVVPGQMLTPGTTVTDVMDLSQIDLLCFAPPRLIERLHLHQPALLVRDETQASTEKPLEGTVEFIALQAQPETGNFAVKVRFAQPDPSLRSNAVRRVRIKTRPEKERLTLPLVAVMEDQEPPIVLAALEVNQDHVGKAKRLQVKLGIRDRVQQRVEILELLDPEKKEAVDPATVLFITEGGHGLRDDDVVKIEEAEKEKPDE